MIILHVSNLRFNRRWYRWILEKGPRHDLLVIAGNLVDRQSDTSIVTQRKWVRDWLVEFDRPVCVASGPEDRDFDPRTNKWRAARWLQEIDSISLCVDGGFVSHNGFSFHCIRNGGLPADRHADVWITYCDSRVVARPAWENSPSGSDLAIMASPQGSLPPIILSGHAGNPSEWQTMADGTLHLNPGWMPHAAFPNHVLLDPVSLAACRVSETGNVSNVDVFGPVLRRTTPHIDSRLMLR